MFQKIFNTLAVVSFLMSGTIVAGVGYIALNKEEIKSRIIDEAIESVKNSFPGFADGSLTGVVDTPGVETPQVPSVSF